MKSILYFSLLSLSLNTYALNPKNLTGKWKAVRYLEWGLSDDKVTKIKNIKLAPEHFGYLLYNPKQTIQINIANSIPPRNEAETKTEKVLQEFNFTGEIKSDSSILDKGCTQVPFYKSNFACEYKPNTPIQLKFTLFDFNAPEFDDVRKIHAERFAKEGIKDIIATGVTSNIDRSTGGSLVYFLGKNNLLITTSYFEKPIKAADALNMKCPAGNKCFLTSLMFERVK